MRSKSVPRKLTNDILPFTSLVRIKKRLRNVERSLDFSKCTNEMASVNKNYIVKRICRQPILEFVRTEREFFKKSDRELTMDIRKTIDPFYATSHTIDQVKQITAQDEDFTNSERNEKQTVANLETWDIIKGNNNFSKTQYGTKLSKKTLELERQSEIDIMRSQKTLMFINRRNTYGNSNSKNARSKNENDIIKSEGKQQQKGKIEKNQESMNINYEATETYKYKALVSKLEKKKLSEHDLIKRKKENMEKIKEIKQIMINEKLKEKLEEQKVDQDENIKRPEIKETVKIIKRKKSQLNLANYEEILTNLKKEAEEIKREQMELSGKIEVLKYQLAILREELYEHYHKLLMEGVDTRNEGLSWIIKAIWNLGKNVNMSKFPHFLDQLCIRYIFLVILFEFY